MPRIWSRARRDEHAAYVTRVRDRLIKATGDSGTAHWTESCLLDALAQQLARAGAPSDTVHKVTELAALHARLYSTTNDVIAHLKAEIARNT
jgi:hypothetical protein